MSTIEQLEEARTIRDIQEHISLSIGQCRQLIKSCDGESDKAIALAGLYKRYWQESEFCAINEWFNEELKRRGLSAIL